MTIEEKLKSYRNRIKNVTTDEGLNELVAFELFDSIKNTPPLRNEFFDRLDYFKNLSDDKGFIAIQDQLFEIIVKILKTVDAKKINELQNNFKYNFTNNFKAGKDEITAPELYALAIDKNSYYKLGDNVPTFGDELSYFIGTSQIRRQYDEIIMLFNIINFYIIGDNKDISGYYNGLIKDFNKIWKKFDTKISITPTKLHTKEFENFFIYCASVRPIEGYEIFFRINLSGKNTKKTKEVCNVIIDALLKYPDIKDISAGSIEPISEETKGGGISQFENIKKNTGKNSQEGAIIEKAREGLKEQLKLEIKKELKEELRVELRTELSQNFGGISNGGNLIDPIPNVFYTKSTGIGHANGKRFQFKNYQPEFFVFAELYENMGEPLKRASVLTLSKYKSGDFEGNKIEQDSMMGRKTLEESAGHASETLFINDLAKKIRKRTGLSKDFLVQSMGDLTLLCKKPEFPPQNVPKITPKRT